MSKETKDRLTDLFISLCLFLTILAVYTHDREVVTRSDSRWTIHLALSMLHERDTDLDEFAEVLEEDDYRVYEYGGHIHSVYPIGTSVAILPIIAVLDAYTRSNWPQNLLTIFTAPGHDSIAESIELALGSAIAALTAVVIYWIGRRALSRDRALLLTLIFAFATPAWSTASRALWQHDLSMLMLALTLLLLINARSRPKLAQYAGLLLAAAYVIRPSNSIAVICFTLFVLITYRPYFRSYLMWAAVIAVPFLFYNFSTFDTILQPYYLPSASNAAWSSLLEGLAGTIVSPNRGLFIYSPVLLFSFVGFVLKLRQHDLDGLDVTLLCIIVLHWLMLASWRMWWGGYAFGPRLFTDMLPFLIYFLIPAIGALRAPMRMAEAAYFAAFTISVLLSLFVHYRGAVDPRDMGMEFWRGGNDLCCRRRPAPRLGSL